MGLLPKFTNCRRLCQGCIAALPMLFALSGCESLPGAATGPAAVEPALVQAKATPAQPAPPAVELTPDLLYDILLGEVARQRGRADVAVESLMRAAEKSRDPRLIERAAKVGIYAKRPEQAIKAATLWVELAPDRPGPRQVLGALLVDQGELEPARGHFEYALGLYGDALVAGYRSHSEILARVKNRLDALQLMKDLVALHPELPEAHLYYAGLARQAKQTQVARAAADRALRLRPGWDDAAVFIMRLLIGAKEHLQVEEFAKTYLDAYPMSKEMRVTYARYLLDQGEGEEARTHFKQVVDRWPDDPNANFAVGLLALQGKDLREAERYLKRNLELKPDNDQARLYLGQIEFERKRFQRAAEWFHQIGPGEHYFESRLRLANAIAKKGEVDEAIKFLAELDPESEKQRVRVYIAEEQILREAKQLERAMAIMNQALDEFPDDTDLLYTRGLLAAQMKLLSLHEEDIRRLLSKEPKNAHALNALGYTLADQTERYDEALEFVQKALELRPDDPFILDSMGWVQYRIGNHDAAIDYLRQAFAAREDAEIGAHLGEVLWVSGEQSQARSVWRRALRLNPDNDILRNTVERFSK